MFRRLSLAPLLALILLVPPASLLACGWECEPEAVYSVEAAVADCHGGARDEAPAAPRAMSGLPHDCTTHAAAAAAELTTPRQPAGASAPANLSTAWIDASLVVAPRHASYEPSAPPPPAPLASPVPLRI